jgi:hypothetical protein
MPYITFYNIMVDVLAWFNPLTSNTESAVSKPTQ